MGQLGINVDAHGAAPPTDVAATGARWVRLVLSRDVGPAELVARYRAAGLRVLVVVARESLAGFDSYEAAADHYARWSTGAAAVQLGNEPDLDSPSSWRMSPAEYSEFVRRSAPTWRLRRAGIRVIGAGLASGDPTWLDGVHALGLLDAIALHPYGQDTPSVPAPTGNFGQVGNLITAYARFGMPIWVTEYGTDGRDEQQAARYIGAMSRTLRDDPRVPVALHFCWSDSMVEPFGLLRRDGSRKPAYEAFRAAAHEGGTSMPTNDERLAQLEKQQGLQSEAIAAILANHYQDGPQSAKGLLVQLDPNKYGSLAVVEMQPKT